MPDLKPDAPASADERLRGVLALLLGVLARPDSGPLPAAIRSRIEERIALSGRLRANTDPGPPDRKGFSDQTRPDMPDSQSYLELLDRASAIFVERLPATIEQAIGGLVDKSVDAAIAELPKPKRKRRKSEQKAQEGLENQKARHFGLDMFCRSLDLIHAIMSFDEGELSNPLIAALYYWKCDPKDSVAMADGRARYRRLSQPKRDNLLRAYTKLLKEKVGMTYKELKEIARMSEDAARELTLYLLIAQPKPD